MEPLSNPAERHLIPHHEVQVTFARERRARGAIRFDVSVTFLSAAEGEPHEGTLERELVDRADRLADEPRRHLDDVEALGRDLWTALPEPVQADLRSALTSKGLRVVLAFDGAATLQRLPWEALRVPQDGRVDAEPFVMGHWLAVRRDLATSWREGLLHGGGNQRVLVIVGSQRQGGAQLAAEWRVLEAFVGVRAALDGLPYDVAIAAARGLTPVLHDVPIDHLLVAEESVRVALTEFSPHVVHYIGHSDADPMRERYEAEALTFDFGARQTLLAIERFAAWLPEATRLVVLHACLARERVARSLLARVEHVVGTGAMIPPRVSSITSRPFYEALAHENSVERAVRCMRDALVRHADPAYDRRWAWVPLHWTRTRRQVRFVDETRRLVETYAEAVIDAHRNLHGPLLEVDAAIEQVPVEVQVATGDELARREPAERELHSARTVALLLETAPRRFAILGEAGSGKTTSLRYLARQLAETCLSPSRTPLDDVPILPLFVSLPQWIRYRETRETSFEALVRFALRELDLDGERLHAELQRRAEKGQLAVLLDALDEVPADQQEDVERLLGSLFRTASSCPVLLTSRPYGRRARHGTLTEAHLLPLPASKQSELLHTWFDLHGVENAEELVKEAMVHLSGDDVRALPRLAGVPLFLTLIAREYVNDRNYVPVANRAQLLEDWLSKLLRGELKGTNSPAHAIEPEDTARDVLRVLALRWTEAFRYAATLDEAIRTLRALPAWPRACWTDPRTFLEAVARTFLLGPADGHWSDPMPHRANVANSRRRADAPWRFWHRAFQETLTAEALFEGFFDEEVVERRLRDGTDPKVDPGLREQAFLDWVTKHLSDAKQRAEDPESEDDLRSFAEPIALLCSKLERPDALIHLLVKDEATRPIGLQAIALVDRLALDTLRFALEQCNDIGERTVLYEALGERMDREALALLEAQVSKFPWAERDAEVWQELYEIDEALRRMRSREGAPADAIEDARRRIFEYGDPTKNAVVREQLRSAFLRVGMAGPAVDHPNRGELPEAMRRAHPRGHTYTCRVQPGWYQRGTPEGTFDRERPSYPVHITRAFEIGAVTVTYEQFRVFDPEHEQPWTDPLHPAVNVSWYQSTMFARWAGWHLCGQEGRLPTESEWEYAARAERFDAAEHVEPGPPYWCGETLTEDVGYFGKEPSDGPRTVTRGTPNDWGLREVHGNVWEWCSDRWDDSYPVTHTGYAEDPLGPKSGAFRVRRGGCYWDGPEFCRSASRLSVRPDRRVRYDGFRLVLPVAPELG